MIVLAGEISPVLQTGYSVLMTLSMVVSALGFVFAASAAVGAASTEASKKSGTYERGFVRSAFVFSRFGFGTLVGVFYPICGYLGIPFVVMLFLNWKSAKKK